MWAKIRQSRACRAVHLLSRSFCSTISSCWSLWLAIIVRPVPEATVFAIWNTAITPSTETATAPSAAYKASSEYYMSYGSAENTISNTPEVQAIACMRSNLTEHKSLHSHTDKSTCVLRGLGMVNMATIYILVWKITSSLKSLKPSIGVLRLEISHWSAENPDTSHATSSLWPVHRSTLNGESSEDFRRRP